jgi:hypothetical protein
MADTATKTMVSPLPEKRSSGVIGVQATKSQQPAKSEAFRGTKRVWYYELHGFVYGPTSAQDIYGRILDGRLPQEVNVWKQGSSDWAPATDYVLFSREGPDAADAMEQDSVLETDALPPMVSMDGKTTYKYCPDPDETVPGTYTSIVDLTDSVSGPHPWYRYFARMFDLYIFVFVFVFISSYFGLSSEWFSTPFVSDIAWGIAAVVFLIPIESLCLSLCETTPGKWLLGISVSTIEGHKPSYGRALLRSALVASEGLVLGIPLLYLIGLERGWRKLNETNTTPWDIEAGTVVHHRPLSVLRIVIFAVAIVSYLYLITLRMGK